MQITFFDDNPNRVMLTEMTFGSGFNQVGWKNFAGAPNAYGNTTKNFHIFLNEEDAAALRMKGWPVKEYTKPGNDPTYHLQVSIKYRDKFNQPLRYQPQVQMKIGDKVKKLTEDTIADLDSAYFVDCKVIINKSEYQPGKSTIYLNRMNVECEMARDFSVYESFDAGFDIPELDVESDELPF